MYSSGCLVSVIVGKGLADGQIAYPFHKSREEQFTEDSQEDHLPPRALGIVLCSRSPIQRNVFALRVCNSCHVKKAGPAYLVYSSVRLLSVAVCEANCTKAAMQIGTMGISQGLVSTFLYGI